MQAKTDAMGASKAKPRKPEDGAAGSKTTSTAVSKPFKHFEKAMQKFEVKNVEREREKQALEAQAIADERLQSFGPPLFHRVMRKVAESETRPRRKSSLVQQEAEAKAKAAQEETKSGEAPQEPGVIFKFMSYNVLAE